MDSALSFRVSADPHDRPSLARLVGLPCGPALVGPLLLAEENGRAVAAVALESGDVMADPDRSSAGLITLLQLRRLEARVIGALVGG
jgi:hypothetical protein